MKSKFTQTNNQMQSYDSDKLQSLAGSIRSSLILSLLAKMGTLIILLLLILLVSF